VAWCAAHRLGWRWYASEAARQLNPYLERLAPQKIVRFSVRFVLAVNQASFPDHKRMLHALESVPCQLPGMRAAIDTLVRAPGLSGDAIDRHRRDVLVFVGIDLDTANASRPTFFMRVTELRWMPEEPAIDDQ